MTKFMDPKFNVVLGGEKFGENYDRIDWRRDPKCVHCSKLKSEHFEVQTLGGPNLCCVKVDTSTLGNNEMLRLSDRFWFKAEGLIIVP